MPEKVYGTTSRDLVPNHGLFDFALPVSWLNKAAILSLVQRRLFGSIFGS